jgi:anti-anti-sigma factor
MIDLEVNDTETAICRPIGVLDVITAPNLRHAIAEVAKAGHDLVLDLSGVQAIDAVGVSALVGSVRRIRALGHSVEVIATPLCVARVLQLAGVEELLKHPRRLLRDDSHA